RPARLPGPAAGDARAGGPDAGAARGGRGAAGTDRRRAGDRPGGRLGARPGGARPATLREPAALLRAPAPCAPTEVGTQSWPSAISASSAAIASGSPWRRTVSAP